MKVFGITGWSGSGKTTLIKSLIPEIKARGFSVSTIKHAHHTFDVDKPGKDSFEHRRAGACEVLISSSKRWVLMHENNNDNEPSLGELLKKLQRNDLVLVEGFKNEPYPKLEVFRDSVGKPPLWRTDDTVIAVASDTKPLDLNKEFHLLSDIFRIADFVIRQAMSVTDLSGSLG